MTTNREGRRFESCRARQGKPRKSRGFALNVHPFSWLGSPFDRNKGLEIAFRALLASLLPCRPKAFLFGCWARRAAYRMGAHEDDLRQLADALSCVVRWSTQPLHVYTGLI